MAFGEGGGPQPPEARAVALLARLPHEHRQLRWPDPVRDHLAAVSDVERDGARAVHALRLPEREVVDAGLRQRLLAGRARVEQRRQEPRGGRVRRAARRGEERSPQTSCRERRARATRSWRGGRPRLAREAAVSCRRLGLRARERRVRPPARPGAVARSSRSAGAAQARRSRARRARPFASIATSRVIDSIPWTRRTPRRARRWAEERDPGFETVADGDHPDQVVDVRRAGAVQRGAPARRLPAAGVHPRRPRALAVDLVLRGWTT